MSSGVGSEFVFVHNVGGSTAPGDGVLVLSDAEATGIRHEPVCMSRLGLRVCLQRPLRAQLLAPRFTHWF